MPLDTRSGKRQPVEATAEFKLDESMRETVKLNIPSSFIKCRLLDIGVNGCALDSPYLIPIQTLLRLTIDPAPFVEELKQEHPGPIDVTGQVRSCAMKEVGRYRLAVLFTHIKKEDVDLIGNFIQSQERRRDPRWNIPK